MDGAKVTFGNIESLITNKWLNDSTIEFYYNSLKMNSVYILSCREAHSFFVDGNILNFADKITNYTYLLAPICLNNNHWTCILIDLTKYLFYYFDPLGLVNELALVDLYFDLWQKYYANVFEKKNWKKCPILHPKQAPSDKTNCGVYICMFISQFLENKKISFVNSACNLKQLRSEIKQKIKEASISMNSLCSLCACEKSVIDDSINLISCNSDKCNLTYHESCLNDFKSKTSYMKILSCVICNIQM